MDKTKKFKWIDLKIDNDILIPKINTNPYQTGNTEIRYKLPLDKMEVGDSVFIPNAKQPPSSRMYKLKMTKGYLFSYRRVKENGVEGIRMWRVLY